jgi:uncharacterized protein with PIN domain
MTSALPPAVLCPRCSLPLRSVSVSTAGQDGATTVHAVCDHCQGQWTYPHWDPVAKAGNIHRRVTVTAWTRPGD